MSKAFTRENDNAALDDEDEALAALEKLPVGTRNYMTPAGHDRLKSELDELLKRERPRMVEVVAWAASNGDRSENGDYLYGKKRLREIDRRIRYLTKRLANAQVVDPTRPANAELVFFGATVTVVDNDGEEQSYSIVGLDEADAGAGRLSWTSPLACALLRGRVGDCVRFMSPSGWREVEISLIRYKAIE